MSDPILLDSTVLIDALRNKNERRSFLAGLVNSGQALVISTLSVAEVYSGMRAGEEKATSTLLRNLDWIPVSGAVAERAGRMKGLLRAEGQTRSLADMIIAATALEHGCGLATDNARDYEGLGVTFVVLP